MTKSVTPKGVEHFGSLGRMISRSWLVWLTAWVVLGLAAWAFAPRWRDVARDGEFHFLPPGSPSLSRRAPAADAFPGRAPASSLVIVVSREDDRRELTDLDRRFIADKLRPAARRIAGDEGGCGSAADPARPHSERSDHRTDPHVSG